MDYFDIFWGLYARKKDKKRARKYFDKLPKATQLECIEGVKNYVKEIEVQGTIKKHIKHPSTFINGENWEDEFETEADVKVSATDFKMDAVGSARIGYCTNCNKSGFYDKFTVHQELSQCCGRDLAPCRV